MNEPKGGIALDALAKLSQMNAGDLQSVLGTKLPEYGDFSVEEFVLDVPAYDRRQKRFPLSAALAIEIARQLSDEGGIPLVAAFKLIVYTGALRHFEQRAGEKTRAEDRPDRDLWVAVLGARNTWGNSPREGWPVSGFGADECWAYGHYEGTYDAITAAIKSRMIRDTVGADMDDIEPSDFARVFMVNVSAADRRLHKRAADLGIKIEG